MCGRNSNLCSVRLTKNVAFDPITEGALFGSLAEQHTVLGRDVDAEDVLDAGLKRLKKDASYATVDLQKQARTLKRRKKK